jgi:DNA-nicking Smr family endonuclease
MTKQPDKRKAGARKAGGRAAGRPTADEEALFRAAMADAKPIERRFPQAEKPDHPVRLAETPPATPQRAPIKITAPVATPKPAPKLAPKPALEAGKPADLDRRTMDRLRKGRLRPESRIDLHGMTADRAHAALNGFLADALSTDKRCVLVITGKGSLKEGGGIIRRELPAWLNAAGNRSRVLGFAGAQPADGGGGAFYVLLKRRR